MKLVHVLVASCKECPYINIINDCVYYCKLPSTDNSLIGLDYQERRYNGKIPKWCELIDAYEQEDDGEI